MKKAEKENAICFIFQPEKPRRCSQIGISALRIIKKMRPDVNIYLYGSNANPSRHFIDVPKNMKNLGIISPNECNALYNKCCVGLCLSSSNPSRVPFEMMASGLPVVDLFLENNLYDMPDSSISLAEPTPEAIATAIVEILDKKDKQKAMSKAGVDFMSQFPIDKGFEQFGNIVDAIINNQELTQSKHIKKLYQLPAVKASKEAIKVAFTTTIPTPVPIAPTSQFT